MVDGRDRVGIHLDAPDLGPERPVGALARERSGGVSVISFEYEREWTGLSGSFPLDPSLSLYEGEQYLPQLPGIFGDAAPDRWGRLLLERREALVARREERSQRRLDDWDFLVGVNDRTRMGALRLLRVSDATFVSDESLAVPPSTRLHELEHWAREFEQGLPTDLDEEDRWIGMLIAPGSSLGGARPKASFLDEDESLWIAKFPSREDRHDVGGWEYVVSRIAADAGIEVPETRMLRLGSTYCTFCAKRFDRVGEARRLYASAMTLTGRSDHEQASYLDVAQAIVNLGDPKAIDDDLGQLFRRVVFNVLTANRDDHLRNHGFLRASGGWRLAPAFDVNPSPEKHEHTLALDDAIRVPDLEVVRETRSLYRLSTSQADGIIAAVGEAVARWRQIAQGAGLAGDEVQRLAGAFLSA
jgi:serine/threonine-protein kinase HipA